jgi:surface carbohydrate biosynthesis protein (TIGR04326 family)
VANLIVWDSEELPPSCNEVTVLWRRFVDDITPNAISIPSLIEKNAEMLKGRYLAWIYDLGETHIKGRRLVDHLELQPGFSYWWMTLLVEKCNYAKSPQIDHAIRLMAFTDWVTDHSAEEITLVSVNQPLANCMHLWCKKKGIAFKWQRQPMCPVRLSLLRRAYQSLPLPLQALLGLTKYVVEHFPLRGVGLREWQTTNGTITFFSYSLNLVPEALKGGRFESHYWGTLPDALQADKCMTNWLHIHIKDSVLPSATLAAETLKVFNKNGNGKQIHVTLITFLSITVIFRSLYDWYRLTWKARYLQNSISRATSNGLDLWPLFEREWTQSTAGPIAIINTLTFNLFTAALKSLPKQQTGVYLQENQGWEFGLIQAWRVVGHRRLIGAPHSTIRFWDLRYFFDPRSYGHAPCSSFPAPDLIAINGKAATDAYITGSYPTKDLVQVEALRYLHLDKSLIKHSTGITASKKELRVLVVCDYLLSHTKLQMRLLELAVKHLSSEIIIDVKPHPATPININDYPNLKISVVVDSIPKIIAEYEVVYTSSVTSAAVDAYCAGIPVISVLDPGTLNLSPLRGFLDVFFVSNAEELSRALLSVQIAPPALKANKSIFITDNKLPRWLKLLSHT